MNAGKRHIRTVGLLFILPLMGCNLPRQDTAAIQTAAALTVQAAITAAAPSATATSTAAPSQAPGTASAPSATVAAAPTATSSCDKAAFVSETVPDDKVFAAGEDFVKTWTLRNIGSCSWTPSYSLVFVSGDALAGPANVSLAANVNSGQEITLSVNLEAPDANGTYHGNWGLRNAAGVVFSHFWVQIKVGGGGGGQFAVIHVTYSYSTADYSGGAYQDCPTVTAHITTNGAGDVEYRWTRSDTNAIQAVETLHFNSAGTKDVVSYWLLPTAAGNASRWKGIYIEEPNHQDFGHQSFNSTCSAP